MYVGAAGFHPGRVLPCVIDVGVDNERLQNNDLYLGEAMLECGKLVCVQASSVGSDGFHRFMIATAHLPVQDWLALAH